MSPLAPPTSPIAPELLAQMAQFELACKTVAQGAVAGMHRAKQRGTSIAFAEHKIYAPGDDVRHLDWHAYAKTDAFHIKRFEDETNLTLQLWVDHSGSMGFGQAGRPDKLSFARQLAGALAYLALSQGDAAGLVTFGDDVQNMLPARPGMAHFVEMTHRLFQAVPKGPTSLDTTASKMALRPQKRQQIVIFSDLFEPAPTLHQNLGRLVARGHAVAVVHVMDPAELQFDFEAPAIFASMEDDRTLFVHPRSLKTSYVKQMQAFLQQTQKSLTQAQIRYHNAPTDTAPIDVLASYLGRNER